MEKMNGLDSPFIHPWSRASSGMKKLTDMPKAIAGVRIPDSAMALSAARLCRTASPDFLFNHCTRVYVFAAILFAKAAVKFDEEAAFVAAMLHDLGLLEDYFSPDQRFEVDGADAAWRFVSKFDVALERAEKVWDAIAFHTSGLLATRKAPEIAIVALGAGVDVSGRRLEEFSADDVAQVLEAAPRDGFKAKFLELLAAYVRRKPSASLFSWTDELSRSTNADLALPDIRGVMTATRFEE